MKQTISKTEVRMYFPNIDKQFIYTYPFEWERNRVEEAMREFLDKEAPTLFALYGYGPMDISVRVDEREPHWAIKACYQERLWQVYFREGGEPWHGRFGHFTTSLMQIRFSEDKLNAA